MGRYAWLSIFSILMTASIGHTAQPLRYLALGDSYTAGHGLKPAESWPYQLAAHVHAKGLAIAEPVVIAVSGWTTANLLSALERKSFEQPFDLVTLMIGTNDQFQGRDPMVFAKDLNTLIQKAVTLAGNDPAKVLVITLPDWSVTPYAVDLNRALIARDIDGFNGIVSALAAKNQAAYFDIAPASRGQTQEDMFIDDGLHPSAKGYAGWAKAILPEVLRLLK